MLCVHTGVVIVGEDTVGHYDLGIFVASIVPGGPADKDGRIRPGREPCGHFYFPSNTCAKEDREGTGGVCGVRSQAFGVTRGFRGGGEVFKHHCNRTPSTISL